MAAPTPSEQKALAFVAMIVLLGGVVRVVRAGAPPVPTSAEQQAIARQASAADSAREAPRVRKTRAPRVTKAPVLQDGFPPPSPPIDLDFRPNRQTGISEVTGDAKAGAAGREPVDLDRASRREIERLPWVGPTLAGRIVASRDSFGAFGSLEALGRVRGVGSATRKRLAPLVTFSGSPSSRR